MTSNVPSLSTSSAPRASLRTLYRSAVTWAAIGLLAGLFYRTFTVANHHDGGTQLAVVHTHALTLGTVMMLILLAIVAALPAVAGRVAYRRGFIVYQVGLGLTTATMLVKGCLQVLAKPAATSPAIAGIAGLGHITISVGLVMILVAIGAAVKGDPANSDPANGADSASNAVLA